MAEQDKTSFLFIKDLSKSYREKLILTAINLEIQKGAFCTIVGPSGCGKSTLLRLILGCEPPTKGSIIINGKEIGFPCRERGIVFQNYSLYSHLTVLENILLGKKLKKGDIWSLFHKQELREEGMAYLAEVSLADCANKYPYELSGGMQQRVAIAQALFMNPELLLMDEPLGALDPATRERLQMFLLRLWEKHKMTIFFVTHDLEEAVFLGTQVLVLSQYCGDNDCCDGATIALNYPLRTEIYSTAVKTSAAFGELIAELRFYFTRDHKEHVGTFDSMENRVRELL